MCGIQSHCCCSLLLAVARGCALLVAARCAGLTEPCSSHSAAPQCFNRTADDPLVHPPLESIMVM